MTPEIRELAEKVTAKLNGDEARAVALYDHVRSTVKEPNTESGLAATATLLNERGNPAFLYDALLEAAGIDHELGWSRDFSPECDPESDEQFPTPARWARRLLVHVKPRDAAAAWCDMSVRDMPYGKLIGNAPRAEVLTANGLVHLPDLKPRSASARASR